MTINNKSIFTTESNIKTPFIVYVDPNPKDIYTNINFEAYKKYKAGISAEPCIVNVLPNGQPDLSSLIDAKPNIVQLDKKGNPIVYTVANKNVKEAK